MIGLFATLNLGARSLQVQQTGVEVAGQNLANINNPAYARQRVQIQTSLPILTAAGLQGTGAQVVGIQQIRCALLDSQVIAESSVGGYWSAQQDALFNAQTRLGEFLNLNTTGSVDAAAVGGAAAAQSLAALITGLFNGFQTVAASPMSLPERQGLVSLAQTLATGFHDAIGRLNALNNDLNTSLTAATNSVNPLLSDIAELNRQIAVAEFSSGNTANDLRDLRQQKLETLAGLISFDASVGADGSVDISVGGVQLVSGRQVLDTIETYDAGGGQLLVRTAASGTPLTLTGGSIQGTISARDGALQSLRDQLNSLASALISGVNSVYQAGYDQYGNTGASFFIGTDALSIGVNPALATDPMAVQAAGAAGVPGDNSVALAVARLDQQPVAALGNRTFLDAYAFDVADFGTALANANTELANHNALGALLLQQRDSVSGVSLEEEMTSLIAFQKAYQASAKIITTVDEMLATLVNLKR